jgi:hypothetical protein
MILALLGAVPASRDWWGLVAGLPPAMAAVHLLAEPWTRAKRIEFIYVRGVSRYLD